MRAREFIFEAAYDSMVTSMKSKMPDKINEIESNVKWAKTILKKADRITWYLRIINSYLSGDIKLNDLLGSYQLKDLNQLQDDIGHYYGYNDAKIDSYVYKNQTVSQAINDLNAFENEYKKKVELNRPVPILEGDKPLINFPDGHVWWWVDRAYCGEEGRSGGHCGNVAGQYDKTQRILSFRNKGGNVLLTFILHGDGYLGEMKAKNNQKPVEKYHPYIMQLLMLNMIRGVRSGGYAPHMNFSVFDLSDENIRYLEKSKPELIESQIEATPVEILRASEIIRNNKKYQKIASGIVPALSKLLVNASHANWIDAVSQDDSLAIYLPPDMPDYEDYIIKYVDSGELLLKAPAHLAKNTELIGKIIEAHGGYNADIIGGVSPNIKGYDKLCEIAVSKDGYALQFVPEEVQLKYPKICEIAVSEDGYVLQHVPEEVQLKYPKICEIAVSNYGYALRHVPEEVKIKYPKICEIAVSKNWHALQFVPKEVQLKYPKIYEIAVSNDGHALQFVPDEVQLKYPKICEISVSKNWDALRYVPKEVQLKYPKICEIAVSNDWYALRHVPDEVQLKYPKICEIAVSQDWDALQYVPSQLHDKVMTAVRLILLKKS